MVDEDDDVLLTRIDREIASYERSANLNHYAYKAGKVINIAAAAAIPVLTVASAAPIVVAALGGLIVVVEGVLQLNQSHQQWLAHRLTAEALKRERALFEVSAGPYAKRPDKRKLLAERVEDLISQETSAWGQLERSSLTAGED